MSLSDVELLKLARRYQLTQIEISTRSAAAVGKVWARFGGLDDVALAAFRDAAVPIVSQAQRAAVATTDAYIAHYASMASGATVPPAGVTLDDIDYRAGALISDVYERPVVESRVAVSKGLSFVEAMAQGRARAVQLADTDAMLAARGAAREAMLRVPRVVGYRRVANAGACNFCLLATTQRYHSGDLMPIHPTCHCTVAPIVGSKDPGHIIDRATVQRLKDSGFIDQVAAQRVSQAEREVGQVAAGYREKAQHWRDQSAAATDPASRVRYEKRAAEWARKADALDGSLPAPNIEAGKQVIDEIMASPQTFISVRSHPELGPVLQAA